MTDTNTAPVADTPEKTASDSTSPQTASATPDAGQAEKGAPTAEAPETDEPTQDKEPTQAEINRRERNRQRWAAMKARADRADQAEAELHRLRAMKDPSWESYADPNQEIADRVLHTLEKNKIPVLEQQISATREEAAAIERQAFSEAVAEARTKYPDFDSVVFNPQTPFSREVASYVASSDKGVDVAYYLGKNPDVARQLAETFAQSPSAGFIALGRIEGRVSAPSGKSASKAPKPAPIVSGGSNPPGFDAAKASVGDMSAYLKKAGVLR